MLSGSTFIDDSENLPTAPLNEEGLSFSGKSDTVMFLSSVDVPNGIWFGIPKVIENGFAENS